MEAWPSPPRHLSLESKSILEYAEQYEGLFRPDGRYLQLGGAQYYLNRIKSRLPLNFGRDNVESELKVELVSRYLDDMSGLLKEQGDLGAARAHAAHTAFDSVSRSIGLAGAMDFLLAKAPGNGRVNLEHLLNTPNERVLSDDGERLLHIKQYVDSVVGFIDTYLDKRI